MNFNSRHLFLSNEAALGIFNFEKDTTVFVALSSNGEFVKIFKGSSSSIHLTRFCPVNSLSYVDSLLLFRNKFASRPYLCDRFHKAASGVFVNSEKLVWGMTSIAPDINSDGWSVYRHEDGQAAYSICPYKKRLCYLSEATFVPESANKYHSDGASKGDLRFIRHSTVIPLSSAPAFLCGKVLQDPISLLIPNSIPCGATNSSSACDFFDTIEHELHVLKSRSRYLSAVDFAVKVENIDGDIYICSADVSSHQNTDGRNIAEDVTVENWIPSRKAKSNTQLRQELILSSETHYSYHDMNSGLNSQLVNGGDCGCNSGDQILVLKGDYFTFYGPEFSSRTGISMHVSLLNTFNAEEGIEEYSTYTQGTRNIPDLKNIPGMINIPGQMTDNSYDNDENINTNSYNKSNGNGNSKSANSHINLDIISLLSVYRKNAVKLLEYREHLFDRQQALSSSRWTPDCLRPIREERSSAHSAGNYLQNSARNSFRNVPHHVLQNVSQNIPRNNSSHNAANEFFHPDSSQHCSQVRKNIPHERNVRDEENVLSSYGGSYRLIKGMLHQSSSEEFHAEEKYRIECNTKNEKYCANKNVCCRNNNYTGSSSSYGGNMNNDNNHNDKNNNNDYHNNSSCHDRYGTREGTSQPNTKRKSPYTSDKDDNDNVILYTASGEKFTAYPFKSFEMNDPLNHATSDLHSYNEMRKNGTENLGQIPGISENKNKYEGVGWVVKKVRGVFKNRTHIEIFFDSKVRRLRVCVCVYVYMYVCVCVCVCVCVRAYV